MRLKIYTTLFLFSSCNFLFAQDIHFSQLFSSPINLSPSQTGFFDGSHRFVANHRNQWSAVSVPFITFSGSFDTNFKPNKRSNDKIGVGFLINSDKAGDSEFSTNQAYLNLTYIKSLNLRQTSFLSLGIQSGVSQTSINYSKLTFDNQYNGTVYDPTILTDENFDKTNFIHPDISSGISWLYKPRLYEFYSLGLSVSHINRPSLSFYDSQHNKLDRKIIGYFNAAFRINIRSLIMPGIIVSKQAANGEVISGATAKLRMQPSAGNLTNVYIGAWYRNKDAPFIVLGVDYFNLYAAISYDINISQLSTVSHNRGGYEIALIYTWQKFKKYKKNKNACPSFI